MLVSWRIPQLTQDTSRPYDNNWDHTTLLSTGIPNISTPLSFQALSRSIKTGHRRPEPQKINLGYRLGIVWGIVWDDWGCWICWGTFPLPNPPSPSLCLLGLQQKPNIATQLLLPEPKPLSFSNAFRQNCSILKYVTFLFTGPWNSKPLSFSV